MKGKILALILTLAFAFSMCKSKEEPEESSVSADTSQADQAPTPPAPDTSKKAGSTGEKVFNQTCIGCHQPNKAMIGPAFQKLRERRSMDWIRQMVNDAVTLIHSGDKTANCMFEKYKILMPPQKLTDEEIIAVLDYVDSFPYDAGAQSDCK